MAQKCYKLGDTCKTGQKISNVLGQSSIACVYTTEDNHLRWEYFNNGGDFPQNLMPSVAHFDALMASIKNFVPEEQRKPTYHQLGKALFAVLSSGPEMITAFADVERFIESKAGQRARLVYVLACAATAAVALAVSVSSLIWVEHLHMRLAMLGVLGGSIGGLISVLQRSGTVSIDACGSSHYLVVQGAVRSALGALFGVFLAFASKGNVVLGVLSEQKVALFVFTIVAGFSERLVPELLRRLESEGSAVQTTPSNSSMG